MSNYRIITNEYMGTVYKSIERIDDDGTVWSIPMDEANSDYQQYLKDTKKK